MTEMIFKPRSDAQTHAFPKLSHFQSQCNKINRLGNLWMQLKKNGATEKQLKNCDLMFETFFVGTYVS